MKNEFDHIKLGKELRHFVHPPVTLPDIAGFEDGLKEICPKKINDLLERAEELKQNAIESSKKIKAHTKRGSLSEFFFATFVAHEFLEYFVIRKWLRYWSELWRKASNKPLPAKVTARINRFGDFEIEQARKFPLERLYEGRLRKVGSRLVGLCPFHKENTASFYIFPDNKFHCFGCGAHGDSIEFIKRLNGIEFPEAIKHLI